MEKNKLEKYLDVVKAFAEGKVIQLRDVKNGSIKWVDWTQEYIPNYNELNGYRVKGENKEETKIEYIESLDGVELSKKEIEIIRFLRNSSINENENVAFMKKLINLLS